MASQTVVPERSSGAKYLASPVSFLILIVVVDVECSLMK